MMGCIRVESAEPLRVGPIVRLLENQGAEVSEARGILPLVRMPSAQRSCFSRLIVVILLNE